MEPGCTVLPFCLQSDVNCALEGEHFDENEDEDEDTTCCRDGTRRRQE